MRSMKVAKLMVYAAFGARKAKMPLSLAYTVVGIWGRSQADENPLRPVKTAKFMVYAEFGANKGRPRWP